VVGNLSSAFCGFSNLDGILKGLEEADAPSHKPQALKRRKISNAKAKAAPKANAKAAPGGKAKAKAKAAAKAKAMAVPAMAAPAVEPLDVVFHRSRKGFDRMSPHLGALSMSRKCVLCRCYKTGKAKAKAEGKSAQECKEAAQEAYQEAAQKWDRDAFDELFS
jgi:hypothetical protein